MPLYHLVCILKAAVPRRGVAEVLRRAAVTVHDAGGVVTDIKSYGTRTLAYDIRLANETHKTGQYVELAFATKPATLAGVCHALRTDERVVRWLLQKSPLVPPVKSKEFRSVLAGMQAQQHGGEGDDAQPAAAPS